MNNEHVCIPNSASYPQRDGKCVPVKVYGDVQRLGNKGMQDGSFYLWKNVWVAGKTAIPC